MLVNSRISLLFWMCTKLVEYEDCPWKSYADCAYYDIDSSNI